MNADLWTAVVDALAARDVRAEVVAREVAVGSDTRVDAVVDVFARDASRRYLAELKRTVVKASLGTLPRSASGLPTLLVASHVTRGIGEQCRALGIDYADAAGNMHLDLGSVLLDVEGRRPSDTRFAGGRVERLFQASGLRVVFALLCDPGLLEGPLRVLAEESGTSLGSVHAVLNELTEAGYVESRADHRRLHHTRRLFDRWTEAYDTNLRPKLVLGAFDPDDAHPWLAGTIDVTSSGALWGGEVAAALLDGHLRPGRATVYADGLPRDLIREYRLRRANGHGLIELRKRFWGDRVAVTASRPRCVPTPLVYADLAASGEARQIEAAGRLRERDDILRRIDAG